MTKRILGLDIGDKRIGMAVSDPAGKSALPLETLSRGAFKKDCARILETVRKYGAGSVVIGLPLDTRDREGPQAGKVRFFAEGLERESAGAGMELTLHLWDESLTSREAEAFLIAQGIGRTKRKRVIDKMAAARILQSWLDAHD